MLNTWRKMHHISLAGELEQIENDGLSCQDEIEKCFHYQNDNSEYSLGSAELHLCAVVKAFVFFLVSEKHSVMQVSVFIIELKRITNVSK